MSAKSTAGRFLRRLECPVDEDADYENTYWTNRDLIPMPTERRTYTWQGYMGYWVIAGVNVTSWTLGSTLLTLGLSVAQAMGVIIGASAIVAIMAVLCGWPGSHQHVGFPILSRSSWGMIGGLWPVLNRVVTGSVWMGIQLYWGGQSVKLILGAIIGRPFIFMRNTLPASANVTTSDLISFFVFIVIFIPLLMIKPENLQIPFRIAFSMITAVLLGTLIWALATADGAGHLLNQGTVAEGRELSWNALFGLMTTIGAWATGVMGQSDWTRYAKTPNAALFGQAITAPLTLIITALFGVLIASASQDIYGEIYWNPFQLFAQAQLSLTASSRAGTFFAGVGLLASQASLCIVINAVAAGMDMATILPKYINIRRGATLITLIGIAICPWNYVNQATTFITVLSGWTVFVAPMTGVLVADYFLVRHRRLTVQDLYIGSKESIYWYTLGVNWRAVLAWAMGTWPILPGFVFQVRGSAHYDAWDNIYHLNYFVGFAISFVLHFGLHTVFPSLVYQRRGESSEYEEYRPYSVQANGQTKRKSEKVDTREV